MQQQMENEPPPSRFASLSDVEILKLMDDKESLNTKKATKQAVNVFQAYLKEKQMPSNIEEYQVSELDDALAKFYIELRQQSGKLYKKTSFSSIRHGINRHLTNHDIVNGSDFPKSQKAFQAMSAELKRQGAGGVDHHPPIEQEDLQKVYNYFDINDPEMLQQKVFFDIMLHFGRRGRENLRTLSESDFALTTDAERSRYIYIKKDEQTKNHQSDTNTAKASMHEIPSQDEKCPVATFLRYKRMLPPGCNYLFPKDLKSPTAAGYHYSKQSIGHNKLGSMMSTLSESAQLSKRYTNHCLRATSVHLLDCANIPTRHIMTVTGHKAESSLKTYTGFTDQKTKTVMSHTISKSLGLDVHGSFSKTVVPPEQNDVRYDEHVLENIDFLDMRNSKLEPLSNSQFDNIMMEFNAPNDPIDGILQNLPVPSYNLPVPSYNLPVPSHNLPVPSHNLPVPSHNLPVPSYNLPVSSHNLPVPSYNLAVPSHNLPVPSYELNRHQASCDSVINYQSNCDSVINYQSSSHAVQSLPAPIISGASANVTINYNFYNGSGK